MLITAYKSIFVLVLFGLISCSADPEKSALSSSAQPGKPGSQSAPGTESEVLPSAGEMWLAKKEEGFYFVLERISEKKSYETWIKYVDDMQGYRREITKPLIDKYGLNANKYANTQLQKVAMQTAAIENDIKRALSFYDTAQVWMAYVTDELPTHRFSFGKRSHIEMSVAVILDEKSPLEVHLGIARGLRYIENMGAYHKDISILLHGFGAKTILQQYPQKRYVVTNPLQSMAKIFLEKLDHQYISFDRFQGGVHGDELIFIQKTKKDPPWIVVQGEKQDKDFKIEFFDNKTPFKSIFIIDNEAEKKAYAWLLDLGITLNGLQFAGDLPYLASLFKPLVRDAIKPQ